MTLVRMEFCQKNLDTECQVMSPKSDKNSWCRVLPRWQAPPFVLSSITLFPLHSDLVMGILNSPRNSVHWQCRDQNSEGGVGILLTPIPESENQTKAVDFFPRIPCFIFITPVFVCRSPITRPDRWSFLRQSLHL